MRTFTKASVSSDADTCEGADIDEGRRKILEEIREINVVQREFSSKSVSTGQDRKVRWIGTAGSTTGNTANAALAAGVRAKKVCVGQFLSQRLSYSTNVRAST